MKSDRVTIVGAWGPIEMPVSNREVLQRPEGLGPTASEGAEARQFPSASKADRCSGLKARSVPVTRGSDNLNGGSRVTVLGHWQTPTASEFESRFDHWASVRSLRLGCFGLHVRA